MKRQCQACELSLSPCTKLQQTSWTFPPFQWNRLRRRIVGTVPSSKYHNIAFNSMELDEMYALRMRDWEYHECQRERDGKRVCMLSWGSFENGSCPFSFLRARAVRYFHEWFICVCVSTTDADPSDDGAVVAAVRWINSHRWFCWAMFIIIVYPMRTKINL